METIRITAVKGKQIIEVNGTKGEVCKTLTAGFLKGVVEQTDTLTDEFYETPDPLLLAKQR